VEVSLPTNYRPVPAQKVHEQLQTRKEIAVRSFILCRSAKSE